MMEEFRPARFEASGSLERKNRTVQWNAVCEDYPAYTGDVLAGTLFTYSFIRTDGKDRKNRPVMFCYNGGPGCGSAPVLLGFFSPLTADLGDDPVTANLQRPYRLEANENCLLDLCDIVVIDALGTGYSKVLDEEKAKEFYNLESDGRITAALIRNWLKKNGRTSTSKVYLAGESFGTLRNCYTLAALEEMGIWASGVVMIGSCLTVGEFPQPDDFPETVSYLPTMAAVHHYHHPEGKPSLEEFVAESRKFCEEEYIAALFVGNRLSQARKEHVLEKLKYFTGIPKEILLRENLRPTNMTQRFWLLKDQDKNISCYDGRFTIDGADEIRYRMDPVKNQDALDAKINPVFQSLISGEFMERMKIDFDRNYQSLNWKVNEVYTLKRKTNALDHLVRHLKGNPDFCALMIQGYYDMCTVTGITTYMMDHIPYGRERVILREYPSGHMTYVGKENARAMAEDIRSILLGKEE